MENTRKKASEIKEVLRNAKLRIEEAYDVVNDPDEYAASEGDVLLDHMVIEDIQHAMLNLKTARMLLSS